MRECVFLIFQESIIKHTLFDFNLIILQLDENLGALHMMNPDPMTPFHDGEKGKGGGGCKDKNCRPEGQEEENKKKIGIHILCS